MPNNNLHHRYAAAGARQVSVVLWSLIGLAAALHLGICEDFGLPIAGIVLVATLIIEKNAQAPADGANDS